MMTKIGSFLLTVFIFFYSALSLADQDLQELAEQLKKYDDPKFQYEIGYRTSAKILGSTPTITDQAAYTYINLLGKSLAKNYQLNTYRWTFGILQSDDINAFAASGGFIFVTKGLLKELNSEDELAAVLAHEIAHVKFNHYIKVVKKQMLAEFTSKSLNDKSNGGDLEALSNASTLLLSRGLDKQSEFEADREATLILSKSGYDPSAMADVLSMLEKKATDKSQAMSFLLTTHPHPTQRLQALGACCAEAFASEPNKNSKTQARFNSSLKTKI
jgi:predicted Zn-dependent protease